MEFPAHSKNIESLFIDILKFFVHADREDFDHYDSAEPLIITDRILTADSCKFDFDMAYAGFNSTRWYRYLSEYTDERFPYWLDKISTASSVNIKEGELGYIAPHVIPNKRGTWQHQRGNCLYGVSVRVKPVPRVCLHSRACMWAPTGFLDLSFASLIAERLAKGCKCNIEDVKFTMLVSELKISAWMVPVLIDSLGIKVPRDTLFGQRYWRFYEPYILGNKTTRFMRKARVILQYKKAFGELEKGLFISIKSSDLPLVVDSQRAFNSYLKDRKLGINKEQSIKEVGLID